MFFSVIRNEVADQWRGFKNGGCALSTPAIIPASDEPFGGHAAPPEMRTAGRANRVGLETQVGTHRLEGTRELTRIERLELMSMLFLHGMALATWFVPMGAVLAAANQRSLIPWAFAASALAALLSPLFFGAMADRSVPPLRVLRWISIGSAVFALAVGWGLSTGVSGWVLLLGIQLQSLLSVPTNSLTGSIVLGRLSESKKQFGSIRAWGTIGWMSGCWLISILHVDHLPYAFFWSAALWLVFAGFTWLLSERGAEVTNQQPLTLRERFGFDALALLANRSHRAVFLTSALAAIPFAAFYPYTPAHMSDLGLQRTSAWMSLGQASEVGIMFAIGAMLTRWGLKRVIAVGLFCGILRYLLYALNTPTFLLIGVGLHGIAYTFTYISTQIYLAEQIPLAWRTRAQALLSMMTSGFGNLLGYLLTGGWWIVCDGNDGENWVMYWLGLSAVVTMVFGCFLWSAPRTNTTPRSLSRL